jgi:hypothetical protein
VPAYSLAVFLLGDGIFLERLVAAVVFHHGLLRGVVFFVGAFDLVAVVDLAHKLHNLPVVAAGFAARVVSARAAASDDDASAAAAAVAATAAAAAAVAAAAEAS